MHKLINTSLGQLISPLFEKDSSSPLDRDAKQLELSREENNYLNECLMVISRLFERETEYKLISLEAFLAKYLQVTPCRWQSK